MHPFVPGHYIHGSSQTKSSERMVTIMDTYHPCLQAGSKCTLAWCAMLSAHCTEIHTTHRESFYTVISTEPR